MPEALIGRQEAAAEELAAATETIRQYIAANNVVEVELDEQLRVSGINSARTVAGADGTHEQVN